MDLAAAKVVEHDNVSRQEGWAEEILDVGKEDFPVHRPIGEHRSSQPLVAQGGDKGRRLPMSEGRRSDAPPTFRSAPIAPCHVGRGPCFINEYEPFQIPARGGFSPREPCLLHVLALLLAGVQGFF
jgi:hypothetical protein